MLAESGLLVYMVKRRIMFLAVDQTITYTKPIFPFQKYAVTTKVTVSDDDKWMYYSHSFDDIPDPKGIKPQKHYALIKLKAVMKLSNGKTVRPSDISSLSDYYKDITNQS